MEYNEDMEYRDKVVNWIEKLETSTKMFLDLPNDMKLPNGWGKRELAIHLFSWDSAMVEYADHIRQGNTFVWNEFLFNYIIGGKKTATVPVGLAQGFSAGIGFLLIMVLMSGLREKLELEGVPESMKGAPIAFITAGLMAIAFLGFSGLSF